MVPLIARSGHPSGANRRHDVQRCAVTVLGAIGVVLWIEGGPHPRTSAAWLLLVAILIVSARPMLLCWLFC
jgi:hypothetical protein